MKCVSNLFFILRLQIQIQNRWRDLSPTDFQIWILQIKRTTPPTAFSSSFAKKWCARFAHHLWPKNSCVVAACSYFVLVSESKTISVGVRKSDSSLLSHAWADGPNGGMQTDRLQNYEPLWEIKA